VNPAIQGYTAAVADALDEAARRAVAGELAAVEQLLATNEALRDAMTDVAVPPRARRAVLQDLLSGRISNAAARVASFAAGAVHAQEVPAAIAWVANHFHKLAEDETATAPVLGHRQARERVGGFAAAVFEDLSVAELEDVEDELFRFARIVGAAPELRFALSDRDLAVEARRGLVDGLLTGKVQRATLLLVDYAVIGGRPRDFVGTVEWLAEHAALARGWRVARVRSGQAVDDDERRKLEETLSRVAGSPVQLQVTVDPTLLAGVDVEIGDLRLDATARGRLERLRDHIVPAGWTDVGFGRVERAVRTGAGRRSPDERGEPRS
jgi:F-type H+-transporting ATPase subunit delta